MSLRDDLLRADTDPEKAAVIDAAIAALDARVSAVEEAGDGGGGGGASLSAITINVTGTWDFMMPRFTVIQPFVLMAEGLSVSVGSKCAMCQSDIDANDSLLTVEFPDLAGINSDIKFRDNALLTSISLAALEGISGTLEINGNANLTGVDLSLLQLACGSVSLIENPAITEFDLPAFVKATSDLYVGDNVSLEEINLPEFVSANAFTVGGNSSLTDVFVPLFTEVGGLTLNGNNAALHLDFSSLERSLEGVTVQNHTLLETVDFSGLASVGNNLQIDGNTALESIDFPALTSIGGTLQILNNVAVEEINAPLLEDGSFYCEGNTALTVIDLTSVETLSVFRLRGSPSITSVSLPALQVVSGGIDLFEGDDALTSFTLNAGLLEVGGDVYVTGTALSATSVSNLLIRLAALDGTGGTTSYDNHIVDCGGGCDIPNAGGLTAKGVLEGRGCTVTVNS